MEAFEPKPLEDKALAQALLHELEGMHHLWGGIRPPAPLGKTDLSLMGNMIRLQDDVGDGPVTVSRLARVMKQSMPGVSQRISQLEKLGYVHRLPAKEDRRVVGLELTGAGRAMLESAMQQMLGVLQRALEEMGEQQSTQLIELLRALQQTIVKIQEDKKA